MVQPNKYNPQIRFSNSPYNSRINRIDPVELDNELKNISESINAALKQLELIQRDDGYIADDALGEYKKRIQDETLAQINSYIPNAVKKAVDNYIKSGNLPNAGSGGTTSPVPPTTGGGSAIVVPDLGNIYESKNYEIGGMRYGANMSSGFRRVSPVSALDKDKDFADLPVFNQDELTRILTEANANSSMAVLPRGLFRLDTQIRVTPSDYPNIQGIQGAGIGETVIVGSWAQKNTWDSNTNKTNTSNDAVILFEKVSNKNLKNLTVKYTGEFYREKHSYFGCVNTVMFHATENCVAENVEATGANRAGIFLGANDQAFAENDRYYRGEIKTSQFQHHGKGNIVRNCYAHHNRVAGILIQNQLNLVVAGNTASWNGHERDGGTGYGIAAFSGSVNDDVVVEENLVESNYRKGIDSHDSEAYTVRNNTIRGNRFFGVAIESRGYPMRLVDVRRNAIIQDPAFRLELDDEHTDWTQHRNSDYYRYSSVRVENKSQPGQRWKNQPAKVDINILDNYIDGLDWDNRGISRLFEIRNHEQADHVRLNTAINNNIVRGKRVHNLLFAVGESTAYNGLGNFSFSDNDIKLDSVLDEPLSIGERNSSGFMHGAIVIKGNTINSPHFEYSSSIVLSNRALAKINGNTIINSAPNDKTYFNVNTGAPSVTDFEVMNNVFDVPQTPEQMSRLVVSPGKALKNKVNVFGNRIGSTTGDVIQIAGYKNTSTQITPSPNIDPPAAPQWADKYVKPQATVEAPQPLYKPDFNQADSYTDGQFKIILGGSNKNANYGMMFDLNSKPKIAKAMLLNPKASAGVYPRAEYPQIASGITTVFGIKIKELGGRGGTGVAINGFGRNDSGSDVAVSGGIVAVSGSRQNRFRFTKTVGILVDGVQYDGSELELDRWYVIVSNAEINSTYAVYGSIWNGNGQVTADIANKFEIHGKILNAAEATAASLRVMSEIESAASGSTSQPSPPNTSPDGGNGNAEPPAIQPSAEAVFGMDAAEIGQDRVSADEGTAILVSVKNNEKLPDDNWGGMVIENGGIKAVQVRATAERGKVLRYIRMDNIAVGSEESVIIFPFKVLEGGHSQSAPILIATLDRAPVVLASGAVSSGGLGWNASGSAGFTINNAVANPKTLLELDKWYIGMLKQSKAFNSINFGTNHVLNIFRNVIIGSGVQVLTGKSNEEIQAKYEALKQKYGI